jgi:hypothetical protein
MAGPARGQPGRSSSSAPTPQTPTIDIGKELSNAEAEAKRDDEESARSALRRIETIETRLVAGNDILRAGMAKAEAWLTLNDKQKACAALSSVKDRAVGTPFQSKVDDLLLGC